jgi:hypothetical protein
MPVLLGSAPKELLSPAARSITARLQRHSGSIGFGRTKLARPLNALPASGGDLLRGSEWASSPIVSSCVWLGGSVRRHQSALRTNRRLHRGGG